LPVFCSSCSMLAFGNGFGNVARSGSEAGVGPARSPGTGEQRPAPPAAGDFALRGQIPRRTPDLTEVDAVATRVVGPGRPPQAHPVCETRIARYVCPVLAVTTRRIFLTKRSVTRASQITSAPKVVRVIGDVESVSVEGQHVGHVEPVRVRVGDLADVERSLHLPGRGRPSDLGDVDDRELVGRRGHPDRCVGVVARCTGRREQDIVEAKPLTFSPIVISFARAMICWRRCSTVWLAPGTARAPRSRR